MGVPELEKGAYVLCEHVCSAGCDIYAERPTSCGTFECQWLRGLLEVDGVVDPRMRPDACGVIFDYQPGTVLGDVYTAWEVEPGASVSEPARSIIDELQERFLIMLARCTPDGTRESGEREFLGPPHLVALAVAMRRARD